MIEDYKGLEDIFVQAAENAINRLVEETVDVINSDEAHYTGVEKEKAKRDGDNIVGSYYTYDPIDIIKEFGSGYIGSANPSTSQFLKDLGGVTTSYGTYTMYDTNGHGEDGWYYPKNGKYYHTWGNIGRNVFTDASMEMEAKANAVLQEEIHKLLGG